MPTFPSSAFVTRAASICCAATLLAESGIGFWVPGKRPYHFLDLRVTFLAPGVPGFTRRRFTSRAPRVSLVEGKPSASIQQLVSQCCTTVILKSDDIELPFCSEQR